MSLPVSTLDEFMSAIENGLGGGGTWNKTAELTFAKSLGKDKDTPPLDDEMKARRNETETESAEKNSENTPPPEEEATEEEVQVEL